MPKNAVHNGNEGQKLMEKVINGLNPTPWNRADKVIIATVIIFGLLNLIIALLILL